MKHFLESSYREVRVKYWKENLVTSKEKSHSYYSSLRKKKTMIRSFFTRSSSKQSNPIKNLILVERRQNYDQEKIKSINVVQIRFQKSSCFETTITRLLDSRIHTEKPQRHFISRSYTPSVFVSSNLVIDHRTLNDPYKFFKTDLRFIWLHKSRSTLDFLLVKNWVERGLNPRPTG